MHQFHEKGYNIIKSPYIALNDVYDFYRHSLYFEHENIGFPIL